MKKVHNKLSVLAVIVILFFTGAAFAEQPQKKLIEYGWDLPYPDFVSKNIREMEAKPFNGIMFRLREFNHLFDTSLWDEKKLLLQIEDLRRIRWVKFTDNFLCMYAANKWEMDWFNDEHWKIILSHIRRVAKIARSSGIVGLCLDPEPYGSDPWDYNNYKDHSFIEVSAKVRERGKQFIKVIQDEMPEVRLLTLYNLSFYHGIADIKNEKEKEEKLKKHLWPLYPAFLNGLFDGVAPEAKIVDGYEQSYTFDDAEQYSNSRYRINTKVLPLLDSSNQEAFKSTISVGMSIYIDYLLGLRPPPRLFTGSFLDSATQLKWLEHNVYYALTNSDEYVWLYSENMDWWRGKIPEGVELSVRSAIYKYEKGSPLEFNIKYDVLKAKAKKKINSLLFSPKDNSN